MDALIVKDFIKVEDKIDMVNLSILEATLGDYVNPMLLDILLSVNMVLTYTEVEVDAEMMFDKFAVYDEFNMDGTFDTFYADIEEAMPGELKKVRQYCDDCVYAAGRYDNSLNGVVNNLKLFAVDFLDQINESVADIKEIDFTKLSELSAIAKALGATEETLSPSK